MIFLKLISTAALFYLYRINIEINEYVFRYDIYEFSYQVADSMIRDEIMWNYFKTNLTC